MSNITVFKDTRDRKIQPPQSWHPGEALGVLIGVILFFIVAFCDWLQNYYEHDEDDEILVMAGVGFCLFVAIVVLACKQDWLLMSIAIAGYVWFDLWYWLLPFVRKVEQYINRAS